MIGDKHNTPQEAELALQKATINFAAKGAGLQVDTLKVVTCPVCRAVYMPLLHSQEPVYRSLPLLDTAFLHICHFCLRCQRPACPQCWNQTYNLCTLCSEAAHLPFQSPLASFEGLTFAPPIWPQITQSIGLSFACLRNGCTSEADEAQNGPAPSAPVTPKQSQPSQPAFSLYTEHVSQGATASATTHYPAWLHEVMAQKSSQPQPAAPVDAQQAAFIHSQPVYNKAAFMHNQAAFTQRQPEHNQAALVQRQPEHNQAALVQRQPERNQAALVQRQPERNQAALTRSLSEYDKVALTRSPQKEAHTSASDWPQLARGQSAPVQVEREGGQFGVLETPKESVLLAYVENTLIFITSFMLAAILIMIALGLSSPSLNTFFSHWLHIDIRSEIAYILQLI